MTLNLQRNVAHYLYAENAPLKQKILQSNDEHRDELSKWTKKCGVLGNDIGRLRKQIEYLEERMSFWSTKCGVLGNEVGRLRKQLVAMENDYRTERCRLNNDIDQLRANKAEFDSESKNVLEKDQPEECIDKFECLNSTLSEVNIRSDSDSLHENTLQGHQMNEEKIIDTIKDSDNFESELDSQQSWLQNATDEETKHDAVENNDESGDIDLSSIQHINGHNEVHDDEEIKQKPKFSLWNALKKHVATKYKQVKSKRDVPSASSTLTSDQFSETEY